MIQVWPVFSEVEVQVSLSVVKSSGFVPVSSTLSMARIPVPLLETVRVYAALVVPISCRPKSSKPV